MYFIQVYGSRCYMMTLETKHHLYWIQPAAFYVLPFTWRFNCILIRPLLWATIPNLRHLQSGRWFPAIDSLAP